MSPRILKINASGLPVGWITKEMAAHLICSKKILWSFGDSKLQIMGGLNRTGQRSVLDIDPILAVSGNTGLPYMQSA